MLFYTSFWKNDSCSGNRGLFVFLLIFGLKHWGIVHLIGRNANEAIDLIYGVKFFINQIRKSDTDKCMCLESTDVLLIKPEVTINTGEHWKQL